MMLLPLFNRVRDTVPHCTITMDQLGWCLAHDATLTKRTEAVRTAVDPAPAKLRLGGVCLGGVFQPLPQGYNHGKCRGQCQPHGYRNTMHVNWAARTGITLIDLDNCADVGHIKNLLRLTAGAVTLGWVSARGHGLKVGVLVSPAPTDTPSSHAAWIASRDYIRSALTGGGLTEGQHFRIDPTPAAAQMAILAHDRDPLVRDVDPGAAITWTLTSERIWQPLPTVNPAGDVAGLAVQLDWREGYRSNSMHMLGVSTALHGFDYLQSRANALRIAVESGLVRDYGLDAAIRHYDNGYRNGADRVLDSFGWVSAPAI